MFKSLNVSRPVLAFIIPVLLFLSIAVLVKATLTNPHFNSIVIGITADLLLIIPLFYFLLIRKTNIPKTTVIPVLVVGLVIGTLIIPSENQYFLNAFKTWALPFIELAAVAFVIYKVRKTVRAFNAQKLATPDFFTALKDVCYEIMPRPAVVPFATEIAVFYYGFINWKKRPLKINEFTYHKDSGSLPLLAVLIFIILVETFVIHLLVVRWSNVAAWIITGLSLYTALQLWGFLRSIPKRPLLVEGRQLKLRYGILNETTIDLENIESVEFHSRSIEKEDDIAHLSPLGDLESHNLLLSLKEEQTLHGLYGFKKSFKKLAFFVDDKEDFLKKLADQKKE